MREFTSLNQLFGGKVSTRLVTNVKVHGTVKVVTATVPAVPVDDTESGLTVLCCSQGNVAIRSKSEHVTGIGENGKESKATFAGETSGSVLATMLPWHQAWVEEVEEEVEEEASETVPAEVNRLNGKKPAKAGRK